MTVNSTPTAKPSAVEPIQRSRLLPRFSFRMLFVLTLLGAIIAAIARKANSGADLATAALVTLGFVATCFLGFIVLFLVTWVISLTWYEPSDSELTGSPFASDQLPPQILPPSHPHQ